MGSSWENDEDRNDRYNRIIHLREANSGVEVVFFGLVVKMESLTEKGDEDTLSLLKQTGEAWGTDGVLASAVAVGLDDLEDAIAFIQGLGLQCKNPPVDYCLLAVDLLPCCMTLNDGEIEFLEEEGRFKARMKK